MTPFDDTVVMSDDTDVMPACSLPVPPGEPARRRPPLSGRRRATDSSPAYVRLTLGLTLILFSVSLAAASALGAFATGSHPGDDEVVLLVEVTP